MSGARAEVLLADSVAVSEGRLYVQGGGWNHLFPESLPMLAGRLGIGIVLHLPAAEIDEPVRVALRVEGPDGDPIELADGPGSRALAGVEAQVTPGALPVGSPLDEHVIPLAINLDGAVLAQAGTYRVLVTIDERAGGEAGFAVVA